MATVHATRTRTALQAIALLCAWGSFLFGIALTLTGGLNLPLAVMVITAMWGLTEDRPQGCRPAAE